MSTKILNLEEKFKYLLHVKNVTVRAFCKEIGLSPTGLYDIYQRNTIDSKYLQSIYKKYDVHPCFFFVTSNKMRYDSDCEEDGLLLKELQGKVDLYKKEMSAKDKEIDLLRELVDSKNMLIKSLTK